MATPLEELVDFLKPGSASSNVRRTALNYVLGLTANATDGMEFLLQNRQCLSTVLAIAQDPKDEFNKTACLCLLNVTTEDEGILALSEIEPSWYLNLLEGLVHWKSSSLGTLCQILSNATRQEEICEKISDHCLKNVHIFTSLLACFNSADSEVRENYDYVALVFGNVAKYPSGRSLHLKDKEHLQSLFTYTSYAPSEVRRHGIAMLLKNTCFDIDMHPLLLDSLEVLPALLLPLIGPEDLPDDEMEKLPLCCQYLGSEKQRERSPEIRILLLQALLKLCTTEYGRSCLRKNGAYVVLRDLHKSEKDPLTIRMCENVVEILIRDESDVGAENLMNVLVPEHLEKRFQEVDDGDAQLDNAESHIVL